MVGYIPIVLYTYALQAMHQETLNEMPLQEMFFTNNYYIINIILMAFTCILT